MHIFHALRLTGCRRRATHTFVERDTQASGFALKRAKYELGPVIKVETGPVQFTERMHDECSHVCGVSNRVCFAVHQGAFLLRKLAMDSGRSLGAIATDLLTYAGVLKGDKP